MSRKIVSICIVRQTCSSRRFSDSGRIVSSVMRITIMLQQLQSVGYCVGRSIRVCDR